MKTTSLLTGALFMLLSGAALAAGPKQVDADQASNLQAMGTVQVSGIAGSSDDAAHALKAKAAQDNAGHYQIVAMGNAGDSSLWGGTAILYK
ncbi:YdgH/BhsA/McbA-like domain containing protein [Enterobacteriaceae bacterium C34A]